jgi:A/G-specific adenine glycosylase
MTGLAIGARSMPQLRRALLAWYDINRRDLPWRTTRDPYAVWVSEIMLQQTRVGAVLPRYREFLDRFPTVEKLAAAREASVLAQWSGLGYYRRARNLHAAAKMVAREGKFPKTAEAWRSLPGIGRYTAGAIASVAFGREAPVVDGNVKRVLALTATATPAVVKSVCERFGIPADAVVVTGFYRANLELRADYKFLPRTGGFGSVAVNCYPPGQALAGLSRLLFFPSKAL